jgi:hypothetical protein
VAEIDSSAAHKNFFTADGNYRTVPIHRPKRSYTLKYHLKKATSSKIISKLDQIIALAIELNGTKITYSKRRVCFKTNFKYMTIEVFSRSLYICVKNEAGWVCFSLQPNDHIGRIKKALHRIHGLSNKPRFRE